MSTVFVIGGTGRVGKGFIGAADKSNKCSRIITLTRRALSIEVSPKVEQIIERDTVNSPTIISEQKNKIDAFFSGLGSTRAAAGGFENQYKIDHDLNYECAKACPPASTYCLISSIGASSASKFLYFRMKGELDDEVFKLENFQKIIILRPGILLGDKEVPRTIWLAELGSYFYGTFLATYAGSPIYGCEVGRAAFNLLFKKHEEKVTIVTSYDIYKYV